MEQQLTVGPVIQLLSIQFDVSNPRLVSALFSYHSKVLRSLTVSSRAEKTRSFLATSPVKMLTSFLAGGSIGATDSSKSQRTPVASLFPAPNLSRTSTNNSVKETSSQQGSARSREGIRIGNDDDRPENPLVRLEQTFTGYVASLHARKGNFVGRMILNRGAVDELSVNDLYNKLIESPFDIDTDPDVNADVVFVAFEKFVRIAWREQMGPIMTMQALDALQERSSKRVPGDFADFVHYLFSDMAPQNRRAFTALVKLLADLLDGCANDGDRGALTLAFAELLVDDGSAHNYINLLDLLVDDCDRIFDGGTIDFGAALMAGNSVFESMNSTSRSVKSHNGSMTSNASSLRRKLGFDTLLRQNSRHEESRPSVWRTLSKHGRHPAAGDSSSLSKASGIQKSRSVDLGTAPNKLRRPGSRDRPPLAGAFDDSYARPPSSQKLETIGEPENEDAVVKPSRRKRRSSLSDLKTLMAAATLEDEDEYHDNDENDNYETHEHDVPPLQPLSRMRETSQKFNASPHVPASLPSPSKIPMSPHALRTPRQKENFAEPAASPSVVSTPPDSMMRRKSKHARGQSTSQIPTLRPGRSAPSFFDEARPVTSGTGGISGPSPAKTGSGRLRLQSAQKLRERLQTEKQAVEAVDANLQSELSRITADMARVNSSMPRPPTLEMRKLSSSVTALESRIPVMIRELNDRHEALHRDLEDTLRATEGKVRAIDKLYRESTAENELLYEKFNSELGRIVRALKNKSGEKEDLMIKMKEASEETARAKKDNARLRREMASLRALIKGGGVMPGTGTATGTTTEAA